MGLDQAVPKERGELVVGGLGWTQPGGAASNAHDCLDLTDLTVPWLSEHLCLAQGA